MQSTAFKSNDARQAAGTAMQQMKNARLWRAFNEPSRVRFFVQSAREWFYIALMFDTLGTPDFLKWSRAYRQRMTHRSSRSNEEF